MFKFFKGKLVEKHPTSIVLEIDGVGYEVFIPISTFSKLPTVNNEIKIFVHLHIREDAWQLFGFWRLEEKDLFKLLISISGIGPKLAIAILSGISINDFKQAVVQRNTLLLTSISGIGKKTAERIIVELKEKIKLEDEGIISSGEPFSGSENVLVQDSVTALISLGYKKNFALEAVKKVLEKEAKANLGVEELIRKSLKYI